MCRTRRVLTLALIAACTVVTQTVPTLAEASGAKPAKTVPQPRIPVPAAGTPVYVVKSGDNLSGIAGKLKAPFADLLAANKLVATSSIFPGDQLLVPATAKDTKLVTTATGTKIGVTTTKDGKTKLVIAPATASAGATPVIPADGAASTRAVAVAANAPVATTPATTTTSTTSPAATVTLTPAQTKIEAVIAFAKAQIGKPYVFFSAGPVSFDCSGLTMAAYQQGGVSLIHQSASQARSGVAVDLTTDTIKPGDLVFTASSSSQGAIGHVGLAISATQWIQAASPGTAVHTGAIPATGKILAVRRLITD